MTSWKRGIVVEALRQRGLDVGGRAAAAGLRRARDGARCSPPGESAEASSSATIAAAATSCSRSRNARCCSRPSSPGSPGCARSRPSLAGREVRLTVLATPAGLDVTADGAGARLDARAAAELARLAADHGIARICVDGETIVERARPALAMGGAGVEPPPGAFVQAVADAEAAMVELVARRRRQGQARRRPVLRHRHVHASPGAARARARGRRRRGSASPRSRRPPGTPRGSSPSRPRCATSSACRCRRRSSRASTPSCSIPHARGPRPRPGSSHARRVPVAICVSCNPGTLARDARILLDGGYALESVTPIDQFLYSHHVEAVAVFRREQQLKWL